MGGRCIYNNPPTEAESFNEFQSAKALSHSERIVNSPVLNIQIMVRQALGAFEEVERVCRLYFVSTHPKFPIISETKFYQKLPTLSSLQSIEFAILCLCITLVQQRPSEDNARPSEHPRYRCAKMCLGYLEATGNFSIETIQCKLLIILYEMGHGIYPAASISMGSCARLARQFDFRNDPSEGKFGTWESEKDAAWWMAHNLDRYAV